MSNYPDDEGRDYVTEQASSEEISQVTIGSALIRCKCGHLCNISIPMVCKCGDAKNYWRTLDNRTLKLSEMTLGHLSNTIRHLAAKAGEHPAGERDSFEIALDLLYAELGSREAEIKQVSGIMSALQRSLPSAT